MLCRYARSGGLVCFYNTGQFAKGQVKQQLMDALAPPLSSGGAMPTLNSLGFGKWVCMAGDLKINKVLGEEIKRLAMARNKGGISGPFPARAYKKQKIFGIGEVSVGFFFVLLFLFALLVGLV